jgi:hypothetical protein
MDIVRVRITPGMDIGRVIVTPAVRTTIADPNFKVKPNVSISEIRGVNVITRSSGDVLVYDSINDTFTSSPIDAATISLNTISGGTF